MNINYEIGWRKKSLKNILFKCLIEFPLKKRAKSLVI